MDGKETMRDNKEAYRGCWEGEPGERQRRRRYGGKDDEMGCGREGGEEDVGEETRCSEVGRTDGGRND